MPYSMLIKYHVDAHYHEMIETKQKERLQQQQQKREQERTKIIKKRRTLFLK